MEKKIYILSTSRLNKVLVFFILLHRIRFGHFTDHKCNTINNNNKHTCTPTPYLITIDAWKLINSVKYVGATSVSKKNQFLLLKSSHWEKFSWTKKKCSNHNTNTNHNNKFTVCLTIDAVYCSINHIVV